MPYSSIKETRRLQILEALNDCLLNASFSETSIKEIAKKAGVNHGVLHYYFKNKEDILLNYIDFIIERYIMIFREWLPAAHKKYADQKVFIEKTFHFMYNRITLDRHISKVFIEIWEISLYNKQVRKKLKQMYRIWEEKTTDELTQILKNRKAAKQMGVAMICFLEGVSLLSNIFTDKEYDWKAILNTVQKRGLGVLFKK